MGEPIEVDFAARYWAGDWTEGDVGRRRQAWVLGADDDPIIVWQGDEGAYLVLAITPEGTGYRLADLTATDGRIAMSDQFGTRFFQVGDDGVVTQVEEQP